MLLPNAGKVAESDAEFIYSDAAQFRANGEYQLYGKEYGWEHTATARATRFTMQSQLRCQRVFYAPDFLRARLRVWKADTYHKVGGHDANLSVCDDFDLVIRTYLSGATFHHIQECLYLYRIRADGSNTWLKRNAEIQTKQHELSEQVHQALVYEWCQRAGLPKLDLGGATGCLKDSSRQT
jgi:hypothetical protein